ncbi:BglG family transcription antiterminator [Enterococcus avium]|jgi:lichenan operon transcriptional antiterminator|uniref:BglG family transcription antiterminator n=1 Tax=Enterococcus avium TaxID=33945 RepID=UPI0032E3EB25
MFSDIEATVYQIIISKNIVSLDELALILNKSPRTIRFYIKEINNDLNEENKIQFNREKGGYFIYQPLDVARSVETNGTNYLPQNQKERVDYLIITFLTEQGYIKIPDLAKAIFVSAQTLNADLKIVRDYLAGFSIEIVSKPHYGLCLVGREENCREALLDRIYELVGDKPICDNTVSLLFPEIDLCLIEAILNSEVRKRNLFIQEYQMKTLIFNLAVAILRVRKECYLEETSPQSLELSDISLSVLQQLAEEHAITFPLIEQYRLNELLMSSFSLIVFNDKRLLDKVIIKFLDKIKEGYGIDLSKDPIFVKDIRSHFSFFLDRLSRNISNRNPLLGEIKDKFFFEYDIVLNSLNEIIGENIILEDEIGFLTLHVRAAIERANSLDKDSLTIYLVCGMGMGTSRLIESKLKRYFGEWIQLTKVFSIQEYEHSDLENCDGIITTVDIAERGVPILKVSPLFDEGEKHTVQRFLEGLSVSVQNVERLFHPDLFKRTKKRYTNYVAIVRDSCQTLKEHGYINKNYEKGVLERELLSSTLVGEFVALPHSLSGGIIKPFVYVLIVDHPAKWTTFHKAKIIFMLGIPEDNTPLIKAFHGYLQNLLRDSRKMRNLLESDSYESFIKIFCKQQ